MELLPNISELNFKVTQNGKKFPLYQIEMQDLARAFCGALILALPLLYTMEMWWSARVVPYFDLLIVVVATYFLNVGYNFYGGFKKETGRKAPWYDALVSMAVAFVASAITIALIDRVNVDTSVDATIKLITLEMVPTSFGASLARDQLGGRNNKRDLDDGFSYDFKKLTGGILGAIMFSFNIAPTEEPVLICTSISNLQIIAIILFSLSVTWMMVFLAAFGESDRKFGHIMGDQWSETAISYCFSLLVSAGLLWMFGYIGPNTTLDLALPWIVVLGYATTLGAAAGKLIL